MILRNILLMHSVALFLHPPNRINHRPVDPFDDSYRLVGDIRPGRLSAYLFGFVFEFFDGFDRQRRAFHFLDKVGAQGIDGDTAFGDDDVDEFAWATDGGDFVADYGHAVAEERNRQYDAFAEEAVHPAADAVQQVAVAMGYHVGIEVHIDFGGAEDHHIYKLSEVALAMVIITCKRARI